MSVQQLLDRINFLETRNSFLETRNSFLETRNNFLETRNNFLEARNNFLEARLGELEPRLGILETRINFLERMIGLPLILLGHQGGFVRSTSPHCVQLGLTEFFDEGYTAYQPFTKIASQTFAINYFEVIFKDVENFELIGVYNKDHDIFIGKSKVLHLNNKPQGRIVLGDLDVDGALTFGCGVLWPAKNKFYKESIPHIFFTLNGQKIGKFVPVESGADTFYPKFDEGKEDGDIFESTVNFGPENFLFNVLELDLLGDDYTQEEWSPL
uniref:Uncharacterized protein n=1 Tax=Meloidogyne enterolobii TaxID=390850 RepID=A0A6V7WIS5_MELEN|nr:unnamed protein product [Meloidogyne enterolobii]